MKKIFLIQLLILFPLLVFAQYFSKSLDLNDNNRDDFASNSFLVEDGLVLEVDTYCANGEECLGLMKVDLQGNLLWELEIDSLDNSAVGMTVNSENDILIAGQFTETLGIQKVKIQKYNQEGELVNSIIYEQDWGTIKFYGFYPFNGGYLISLGVITSLNPFEQHPLIIAFDSEFNFLWDREIEDEEEIAFQMQAGIEDGLGNILLTGINASFINNSIMYKFNSTGEEVWKYKHPIDNRGCGGKNALLNNSTESLLLTCPNAWSQTEWPNFAFPLSVVKLTEEGQMASEDILWAIGSRSFGGFLIKENDDLIVSGVGDLLEQHQTNEERQEGWLVSYNSEMEKQWERFIIDRRAPYFVSRGYLGEGIELENGDLIFTGRIYGSIPEEPNAVQKNVWLLRTDHEGCLEPDCGIIQTIDEDGNYSTTTATEDILQNPENPLSVKVFPNPAEDIAYLQLFGEHPDVEKIELIDALGRVVKEYSDFNFLNDTVELTLPDNVSGLCYIRAYTSVGNWMKPLVLK